MDGARRDAELLKQISAGDREAFEALHGRYGRLAYAVSLRVLNDPAEAEEVAQEALLRVWRQADRYDAGRGTPAAWVLTIARHAAIDHLRRRRGDAIPSSPVVDEFAGVVADDPGDRALIRVVSSEVGAAIRGLPPDQRRAIWLTYFAGYTHREAAHALSVPVGTVKSRIRLGLQALRRLVWRETPSRLRSRGRRGISRPPS